MLDYYGLAGINPWVWLVIEACFFISERLPCRCRAHAARGEAAGLRCAGAAPCAAVPRFAALRGGGEDGAGACWPWALPSRACSPRYP